jgi:hypothetical protein
MENKVYLHSHGQGALSGAGLGWGEITSSYGCLVPGPQKRAIELGHPCPQELPVEWLAHGREKDFQQLV